MKDNNDDDNDDNDIDNIDMLLCTQEFFLFYL